MLCISVGWHAFDGLCMCVYAFVLDSLRVHEHWQECCDEWLLLTLSMCACVCMYVSYVCAHSSVLLNDRDNHSIARIHEQTNWLFHSHLLPYFDLFPLVTCMTHDVERVVFGSNKNQLKQHERVNEMKRSKYMRQKMIAKPKKTQEKKSLFFS